LVSTDVEIKWRTVTIAGSLTARLAETDMEAARVIIRRMIWNLTEESGGCAWGAPELIAEAMANHRELAKEFANILVSYIVPDGNYLEYELLQRGAIWGIGRVAEVFPELMEEAVPYLCSLLNSDDVYIKGLTCWALGKIGDAACLDDIYALLDYNSTIMIYENRRLHTTKVGSIAREILMNKY